MDETILQNSVGMRCTVLSKANTFIVQGSIASFEPKGQILQVKNHSGNRALWTYIAPDMTLKIQIKSPTQKGKLTVIDCIVTKATGDAILVHPQALLVTEESRNFFRQNVMRPTFITTVNNATAMHPCVILDISATGIAIQSKKKYSVGDILSVFHQQFRDNGPFYDLSFEVARTSPLERNYTLYGCQFINLSETEENNLCSDIFSLQAVELSTDRK